MVYSHIFTFVCFYQLMYYYQRKIMLLPVIASSLASPIQPLEQHLSCS